MLTAAEILLAKELNGGFCLPCLLFSAPDKSRHSLFNSPLVDFAHTVDNLKSHGERLNAHLLSEQKAVAFRQTVNRLDVLNQLHDVTPQQGLGNIEKLKSVPLLHQVCGR